MAKNISQITTALTRPSGAIIYIGVPDGGNPYGFADRQIEWDNLVLDITQGISDNAADIQTNADNITILQNGLFLQRNLSLNGATSFSLPQNGVIIEINVTVVSGTPTILVGTSLAGSQITNTGALTSTGYYKETLGYRNTNSGGDSASQTIYYTVSSGTVHIHTYYRILSIT